MADSLGDPGFLAAVDAAGADVKAYFSGLQAQAQTAPTTWASDPFHRPAVTRAIGDMTWGDQQKPKTGQETANADAQIQSILDDYGLGSLGQWAYGLLAEGYDANYILEQLRQRPEFKERFPAIDARRAAGLPPVSVNEYIGLEKSYDAYLQAAGLHGMYDRKGLYTKWITGDVSPVEVKSRAEDAYKAALGEPLEVRSELTRLFGVQAGGAAIAYFLDPKNALPKLDEILRGGEVAGGSIRAGYGLLTGDEATRLAQLGVTGDQANQGFGALSRREQLFAALPGEFGYTGATREQQLGAAFEGNAQDQRLLQQLADTRQAAFGGGGQYRVSQSGTAGLGSSTT